MELDNTDFDFENQSPGCIQMKKYKNDYKLITQKLQMTADAAQFWISKERKFLQDLIELYDYKLKDSITKMKSSIYQAENILYQMMSQSASLNKKLSDIENCYMHMSVYDVNFPFDTVCILYQDISPFSKNVLQIAQHLMEFISKM